jgi:hypothetical protein
MNARFPSRFARPTNRSNFDPQGVSPGIRARQTASEDLAGASGKRPLGRLNFSPGDSSSRAGGAAVRKDSRLRDSEW